MYTRCPGCSTVHPVNAAILARNGGRYRCGKCNKTSNALESLFDEWPEAGRKPAPAGDLPVLGQEIDLKKAGESRLNPDEAGLSGEPAEAQPSPSRAGRLLLRTAWLVGGVLIGALIIIKAAEYSGKPILEKEEIDETLIALGVKEPRAKTVFRDLELIHLVSRKLVSDPTRPGTLRLEATIVNRAPQSQPYPDLEIILFDTAGARHATHHFEPADYLSRAPEPGSGMSPHAYLPFSLELEDPGEQAVGFELVFH